jgi:FMNH2-dependent dimethyl sulfone monooxygenase
VDRQHAAREAVSLEDYSVSNRGLNSGLVGTPEQVAERVLEFERAGVDLLLLQFSPQYEEMERFAEEVIPLVNGKSQKGLNHEDHEIHEGV